MAEKALARPVLRAVTVGAIVFALLGAVETEVGGAVALPATLSPGILLEVRHFYWTSTSRGKWQGIIGGQRGYTPTVGVVFSKSVISVTTLHMVADSLNVKISIKQHAYHPTCLFVQVCTLLAKRGSGLKCIMEVRDLSLNAGVVKATSCLIYNIGLGVVSCEVAQLFIPKRLGHDSFEGLQVHRVFIGWEVLAHGSNGLLSVGGVVKVACGVVVMVIVIRDHEGEVAHRGQNIWDEGKSGVVRVICCLVLSHSVVVNEILIEVIVGGVDPDRWVRHDNWGQRGSWSAHQRQWGWSSSRGRGSRGARRSLGHKFIESHSELIVKVHQGLVLRWLSQGFLKFCQIK